MSMDLKPIVKWAGGKRQLLHEITPLIPDFSTYIEPFVGGGAVLLHLQPSHAIVNDSNSELINMYRCVRDCTDELLVLLRNHEKHNSADYYYQVRAWDREPDYAQRPCVERAARILYLNKTCYNGLYRVNSSGYFNTPYGRYQHPQIVNEPALRQLADYLHRDVTLLCGDYTQALRNLPRDSFVYLDPPYMPVNSTSSFTSYTQNGFTFDDQIRLKNECDRLAAQGIHFLQSNSDTPEIRELYSDYEIVTVKAHRAVNSRADKRGKVNEVLIRG